MSTDRPDDRADVIEAAARVMFAKVTDINDSVATWDDLTDDSQDEWRNVARALSDAGLLVSPADQDERDLLRAQVAAVRALHVRNPLWDLSPDDPNRSYYNCDDVCADCLDDWPCDTIQALDTAGGGDDE